MERPVLNWPLHEMFCFRVELPSNTELQITKIHATLARHYSTEANLSADSSFHPLRLLVDVWRRIAGTGNEHIVCFRDGFILQCLLETSRGLLKAD